MSPPLPVWRALLFFTLEHQKPGALLRLSQDEQWNAETFLIFCFASVPMKARDPATAIFKGEAIHNPKYFLVLLYCSNKRFSTYLLHHPISASLKAMSAALMLCSKWRIIYLGYFGGLPSESPTIRAYTSSSKGGAQVSSSEETVAAALRQIT